MYVGAELAPDARQQTCRLSVIKSITVCVASQDREMKKQSISKTKFAPTSSPIILLLYIVVLVLPSCYDEAGSLIGYFSARECCVEKEESRSYRYGDESFPCIGVLMPVINFYVYFIYIYNIVHGFVKTKYGVEEGETLNIVFERNAKGKTRFPLLTIQGSIISEGDEDGKFQQARVT